jgi:ribosome-associated protein
MGDSTPETPPAIGDAPASTDDGEAFALLCAKALADKKGSDIQILDLRGLSSFTDFFVIASGNSEPQIKALSSSVRTASREIAPGRRPLNEDGQPTSQWLAVDFGDVIVHIFHHEAREFYDLESLWKDARIVPWSETH